MKKKSRFKTLRTLFFSMLYISAFTFGGGFVIVTLMKQKFVDKLHWMDESEMLDMTAIAQSSPGAIAVNAAILVGWRMAGWRGFVSGANFSVRRVCWLRRGHCVPPEMLLMSFLQKQKAFP